MLFKGVLAGREGLSPEKGVVDADIVTVFQDSGDQVVGVNNCSVNDEDQKTFAGLLFGGLNHGIFGHLPLVYFCKFGE